MNRYIPKKTSLLFIAAAFLLSFTPRTYKADFSGNWTVNESKSELGEMSRFVPHEIKVEQKEDAITITRVSQFNGNDVSTTETLTFDGKTTESTAFGNSKKKTTAKWSDDGNMLTIDYTIAFERNGQTFDITGTEKWTVEGKALTIKVVSASPQGERKYTAVYEK